MATVEYLGPRTPCARTQRENESRPKTQVRLTVTRPELTLYRTGHFRPLAPNPSTSPTAEPRDLGRSRAAPRDLGRSRAISGDLGAAPRYLGRSRSVARAAAHLLKKGRAWLEPRGSRARSVLFHYCVSVPNHPFPLASHFPPRPRARPRGRSRAVFHRVPQVSPPLRIGVQSDPGCSSPSYIHT